MSVLFGLGKGKNKMDMLQVIYSLLGSSPVALVLVYYLGKLNSRIDVLESRINNLERVQNVCKNFRKI